MQPKDNGKTKLNLRKERIMNQGAPILFLIFNRPRETELVFEQIRKSRPSKLYIASDGPRESNPEDRHKVLEARAVVSRIDWPCEVRTLYRDSNLGCKRAVESALTWLFEHEEEGVILEDDCLPSPDFFVFCNELLDRYRHDERVWVITGNNFQQGKKRGDASYYFSSFPHSWGWATWRRCWIEHDPEMKEWHKLDESASFFRALPQKKARRHFLDLFLDVSGTLNKSIWDYPWTATVWRHSGLTATPNVNLVSNIGFGEDSTHTRDGNSPLSNIPSEELGPLQHPDSIALDKSADVFAFKRAFQGSSMDVAVSKLLSIAFVRRITQRIMRRTRS